ncbi:MAG: hypothetical protein ACQ9MH_09255 [Nitrospinales bacterium]
MIKSKLALAIFIAVGLFLLTPGLSFSDEPAAKGPCDGIEDLDDRNLCLAFKGINKDKENRYQFKNHVSYYCSLVKNRDKQKYCYGVTQKTKSMCDLIVDKKLEEKCNAAQ